MSKLPNGISNFITGCEGTVLSANERDLFRHIRPFGLILFTRNCENKDQIKELVASVREAAEFPEMPVFIDQEGGRVQRLRPPLAPNYVPSRVLGRLYEMEPEKGKRAAYLQSFLIGSDLSELDITVDCLPVLDAPVSDADLVIGDRAYGETAQQIVTLGQEAIRGLADAGVQGVIKHIPGHGRALVDSHKELPVVSVDYNTLRETDFQAFRSFGNADYGMTAHILYDDIDPEQPASHSKTVISDVIRQEIGFDGVLMCDDIGMQALEGDQYERGRRAIDAGCDLILHCNGTFEERKLAASASSPLKGRARERCEAALENKPVPLSLDQLMMRAELSELLGQVQ